MQINSHILKISGTCEIPKELTSGYNYKVSVEGSVPKMETIDNHNGTFDVVYKMKPIRVEVITETGEILKAKDTRSNSELQRSQIIAIWNELKPNCDRDDFYDKVMSAYRHHASKIAEEVIKFNNW